MDPNTNQREQRDIAERFIATANGLGDPDNFDAVAEGLELAERVIALQDWIAGGGFPPEPIREPALQYGVCIDGGVLVTAKNAADWLRQDPHEKGAHLADEYFRGNPDLNGEALFTEPERATRFAAAMKRAYGHDELVTIVLWTES